MSRHKVILFADDDTWFVRAFIEELQESGYKVLQASTGTETLDMLSREQVDLLVLDIMMPTGERLTDVAGGKRTGIHVAEFVRQQMETDLPIIYLTVISDQAVHARIELIEREGGFEPKIIVKPILPEELLEEVQASLSEDRNFV